MLGPRSLLIALVLITGCNGLSLRKADGASAAESLRSALCLQTPSNGTRKYLTEHGLEPGITFDPATTAQKVTDQTSPEGRLVLAELCDLAGREAEVWSPTKSLDHYLNAAWYASRALLDDADELPIERRPDAVAIYNHAVERFLRRSGGRKLLPDDKWAAALAERDIRVTVRRDDVVWQPEPFDEIKFANDYIAIGVPSRKHDGIGVPLMAVRQRGWRDPDRQAAPEKFFPPVQTYPMTALLRFEANETGSRPNAVLEFFCINMIFNFFSVWYWHFVN